jgi:RNA polymerase sigma-70 factor, ECF subfamily
MDAVTGLHALDDAGLVLRAQEGDRTAFAHLVERHYPLVYACACRRVGNRADAEDIAQDVMAKFGRAVLSIHEPEALRGFLLRLSINAVSDFFRRRARNARGTESYMNDPSVNTHQADEVEDRASALWLAVQQLPAQQRDAMLLVYADGASHREAGEALGCAEATISYHVHAARKRLRAMLKEDAL